MKKLTIIYWDQESFAVCSRIFDIEEYTMAEANIVIANDPNDDGYFETAIDDIRDHIDKIYVCEKYYIYFKLKTGKYNVQISNLYITTNSIIDVLEALNDLMS